MNLRRESSDVAKPLAKWTQSVGSFFYLFMIATALILAASTSVAAQKLVKLEIIGGPGGDYFEHFCSPGLVLIGVRGSAGVLIDNVQAVCARTDAGGIVDARPAGPVFGGNRLIDNHVQCTTRLLGVRVAKNRFDPYVGSIELQCKDTGIPRMHGTGQLDGEFGPDSYFGTTGLRQGPNYSAETCPNGTVAVGIRGRAGRFVDAFGLICEVRASTPEPNVKDLIAKEVSLRSLNFPDRYVRHRNALGYIEPTTDDLGRQDATFRIVAGLSGSCLSFESHNFPSHYLRHQNYRLKLGLGENEQVFHEDATFCPVSGLADPNGVSFESVNSRGYYLRHRNFEVWLDQNDGTKQFRQDATFILTQPLSVGPNRRFGVGKVRIPTSPEGTTSSNAGSALTPPFITATPQEVIVSPRRDQGLTKLEWDGGPDHPYAEIWMSIDGLDETFIVEQGKGNRVVYVDLGKRYLFILTDNGQRLATVAVTSKR